MIRAFILWLVGPSTIDACDHDWLPVGPGGVCGVMCARPNCREVRL